jgi:hypothetical protein
VLSNSFSDRPCTLVGFKCETFEALIAAIMGASEWQMFIGGMVTNELEKLQ